MAKRNTETTIATKTLRSHPWHDIHSITHKQMVSRPSSGARIQFLHNGVRCAQPDLSEELIGMHWGVSKFWMSSAIESVDPFQCGERLQHESYEALREQQLAAR